MNGLGGWVERLIRSSVAAEHELALFQNDALLLAAPAGTPQPERRAHPGLRGARWLLQHDRQASRSLLLQPGPRLRAGAGFQTLGNAGAPHTPLVRVGHHRLVILSEQVVRHCLVRGRAHRIIIRPELGSWLSPHLEQVRALLQLLELLAMEYDLVEGLQHLLLFGVLGFWGRPRPTCPEICRVAS